MKKIPTCIYFLVLGCFCYSQNTTTKTAPINFYNHVWNNVIRASESGKIYFDSYYKETNNNVGNARIFLFHKNGAERWFLEAKKKYPKKDLPAYAFAKDILKDSNRFKDYEGYAFFVDKNELEIFKEVTEDGVGTSISYYPKYPHTKILYYCKPGSDKWVEIYKRKINTEQEDKGEWEAAFMKQKIAESNLKNK